MKAYPFPVALFTEEEWLQAYRMTLGDEDAAREARFNANVSEGEAWRVSISALDLAYVSLGSDDLERRVTEFVLEVGPNGDGTPSTSQAAATDHATEWARIREECRASVRARRPP